MRIIYPFALLLLFSCTSHARTFLHKEPLFFAKEVARWERTQNAALAHGQHHKGWIECVGFALMANRIRFVSSCFALAVALDRPLAYRGVHHSRYTPGSKNEPETDALHEAIMSAFALPYELPLTAPAAAIHTGIWEIDWTDPDARSLFTCRDLKTELNEKVKIRISGTFYFLPFLLNNPSFRDYFVDLAPRRNAVSLFVRHLFRPSQQVAQRKDRVAQALGLRDASFVLGLQIRNGDSQQKGYSASQPTGWVSREELRLVKRLAQELAPRHLQDRLVYLVAADTDKGLQISQQVLGSRIRSARNEQSAEIAEAVVDILLLADADALILSYWSSFGELAWILGEHDHVHIVTDVGGNAAAPTCGNPQYINFANVNLVGHDDAFTASLRVEGPATFSCAEYVSFAQKLSCFEPSMVEGAFSHLGQTRLGVA